MHNEVEHENVFVGSLKLSINLMSFSYCSAAICAKVHAD